VVKWSFIEIMFSHAGYIIDEYRKINDEESLKDFRKNLRNPQKQKTTEDYNKFLHVISHELIHFLQNYNVYYKKYDDVYDITSENKILDHFFYTLSNSEINAEFASFKQDIINKIRQNDLKLISLINLRNRILCRYYFLMNFKKISNLFYICKYLLFLSCFSNPDDLEKSILGLPTVNGLIDDMPEFKNLMDSIFKHKTKADIAKIFSNDINTKLLPDSTSGLKDHLDIVMYFTRFCTNLLYYYEKKFLNILYNNFPDDYSNKEYSKFLSTYRKKSAKNQKKKLLSSQNISLYSGLFSNEKNKNPINKKFSLLSPNNRAKKKKDNLLSKINFNIQKTNQNLNNPEVFYSNYFYALLEGGGSQKHNKFSKSMKSISKMLKERKSLQKNFTMKNI
jgi:hypothetical protein